MLASVCRRVSLVASKYARVGADVSALLAAAKAWSWACDHRNSFRELRSGHSGASTVARSLVLEASWFTRPQNERRSVRLLGVGKLAMASVMPGLIE